MWGKQDAHSDTPHCSQPRCKFTRFDEGPTTRLLAAVDAIDLSSKLLDKVMSHPFILLKHTAIANLSCLMETGLKARKEMLQEGVASEAEVNVLTIGPSF